MRDLGLLCLCAIPFYLMSEAVYRLVAAGGRHSLGSSPSVDESARGVPHVSLSVRRTAHPTLLAGNARKAMPAE